MGGAYDDLVPRAAFGSPAIYCLETSDQRSGYLRTLRAELDDRGRPMAYRFEFVLWS
jgi:hypothetical protein